MLLSRKKNNKKYTYTRCHSLNKKFIIVVTLCTCTFPMLETSVRNHSHSTLYTLKCRKCAKFFFCMRTYLT